MRQATLPSRPARSRPRPVAVATYARVQPWLHWVSAALILSMIPTGTLMARTLDDAQRLGLYQAHLLVGWAIVALMVVRLVLRVRRPVAPPAGLADWNRRLFKGVHWAVSVAPLVLALSGTVAILQNDIGPLLQSGMAPPATLEVAQVRDAHQIGAYAFMGLLVVHVGGVVRHQLGHGDTMGRMGIRGLPSGGRRQRG